MGIFEPSINESIFNINNELFGFILYSFFKIVSHSPKLIEEILWLLLFFWLSVEVIWIRISLLFTTISFSPLIILSNCSLNWSLENKSFISSIILLFSLFPFKIFSIFSWIISEIVDKNIFVLSCVI